MRRWRREDVPDDGAVGEAGSDPTGECWIVPAAAADDHCDLAGSGCRGANDAAGNLLHQRRGRHARIPPMSPQRNHSGSLKIFVIRGQPLFGWSDSRAVAGDQASAGGRWCARGASMHRDAAMLGARAQPRRATGDARERPGAPRRLGPRMTGRSCPGSGKSWTVDKAGKPICPRCSRTRHRGRQGPVDSQYAEGAAARQAPAPRSAARSAEGPAPKLRH